MKQSLVPGPNDVLPENQAKGGANRAPLETLEEWAKMRSSGGFMR